MWRPLQPAEYHQIRQCRNPIVRVGSFILSFVMLLPAVFAIVNVISLFDGAEVGEIIGLVVNLVLLAGLFMLRKKFVNLFSEDMEENKLIACDVIIQSMETIHYEGRKNFRRFENHTITACDVLVRAVEDPYTEFHVTENLSFEASHGVGDRVVLICNEEEICDKNMFLI